MVFLHDVAGERAGLFYQRQPKLISLGLAYATYKTLCWNSEIKRFIRLFIGVEYTQFLQIIA